MRTVFPGVRISGILGILPETECRFEDEINNYPFPPKQTLRLQKVMGYNTHRVVKPETATSDLCAAGLSYLFQEGKLRKEDIGALIVVTSTPDYFMPPVSNLLHGQFNLAPDVMCFDLNQGCCAFLQGLIQGFLFLERIPEKKVVVCTSDVLSKKVSKQDRNSYPLIGDGAGIAVLERDDTAPEIHSIFYNDGTRWDTLLIPAGGSRLPCGPETAIPKDTDGDGNLRALDNLCMKGSDVFTFVQTSIPPLIDEILADARLSKDEVDWFLFHQPNKFMLRKLAEKLGVPYEKVPMNIVERFGNSSGSTIPINIAYNLGDSLLKERYTCCLSAFGSGLSWGAMTMELGGLDFCEMLLSNC